MEKLLRGIADESGTLSNLTWTVGSAVVVALIIIGAMVYAPATAENFWGAATSWIRTSFGF